LGSQRLGYHRGDTLVITVGDEVGVTMKVDVRVGVIVDGDTDEIAVR